MIAAAAGADRIELCSVLHLGGISPSLGLLRSVRQLEPDLEIHVLIRPRLGDFCYYEPQQYVMAQEIALAAQEGASGIVIGALGSDDRLDVAAIGRLMGYAEGLHVTFHRAIDQVPDAGITEAVHMLADLGVGRILTSGGAGAARDGMRRLEAMQQAGGDRIAVMAGGGVAPEDFAGFRRIGLNDVHLSAKRRFDRAPGAITAGGQQLETSYYLTDPELVQAAVAAASGASLPG